MARIRVSTILEAPPDLVWADLRSIKSHVEWMHDATAIRMRTAQTEGVGTVFECDTKVGPLKLTDVMEITQWAEAEAMGVRHVGLVTGEGTFQLEGLPQNQTRFTWDETLSFPWWLGGRVGEIVGAPILRFIWKRNLANLAARFS